MMCIGDTTTADTLDIGEQKRIGAAAAERFPAHRLAIHSNEDGIAWAVLSPRGHDEALLRFTICRVAPAVMVLVEDHFARRQFRSLPDVEQAIDFALAASEQALLATGGSGPEAAAMPRVFH